VNPVLWIRARIHRWRCRRAARQAGGIAAIVAVDRYLATQLAEVRCSQAALVRTRLEQLRERSAFPISFSLATAAGLELVVHRNQGQELADGVRAEARAALPDAFETLVYVGLGPDIEIHFDKSIARALARMDEDAAHALTEIVGDVVIAAEPSQRDVTAGQGWMGSPTSAATSGIPG
jgi:hypothetical protein